MIHRLLVVLPLAAIMLCATTTVTSSASATNSPRATVGTGTSPRCVRMAR